MSYIIPNLPLKKDFDTKKILKKLAKAHQALAELKIEDTNRITKDLQYRKPVFSTHDTFNANFA